MSYSIKPILQDHEDKDLLRKVAIQVIYKRTKVVYPTIVKVKEADWNGKEVINHNQRQSYNIAIKSACNGIETRLLDRLKFNTDITLKELQNIVKGIQGAEKEVQKYLVHEYILHVQKQLNGKLTDGRLNHYKVLAYKVSKYDLKMDLNGITLDWIEGFERFLRKGDKVNKIEPLSNNSIATTMSVLIKVINTAINKNLITHNPLKNYKRVMVEDITPVYLTESEIALFHRKVEELSDDRLVNSGYYYLLSCYAGYRISDAKEFDMSKIQDGKLILRAKKNKTLVSMSIHSRLQKVIDYIQMHPFRGSEQECRKNIKSIAALAGIKKDLKFHSSRHSFAMLLMRNGFTSDEVAEFLGDSKDIARVYARIDNSLLNEKILNKLG